MSNLVTQDILEVDYKVIGQDTHLYTPHNDSSIEIIQTWSKGGYFMVKDNVFPIDAGSVFLINAIENHFSNPQNRNTYVRNKLIVSKTYFIELMRALGLEDTVWRNLKENGGLYFDFAASGETANVIDYYFEQAIELYESADKEPQAVIPIVKARISICLTQILLTLFSAPPTREEEVEKPKKIITSITEYINEHVTSWEALSLDEMSNNLHISRSYISHLFKQTTGQSVMQFVAGRRIAEAKKLLINTDMKIQEISDRLNYSNSTVFCKTFKKNVGMTPNEYRQKERNK